MTADEYPDDPGEMPGEGPPPPWREAKVSTAAWWRAVDRLIRIHRPEYQRLLAEERERTP